MNVLQVPPGQSASVMQPKLAFDDPLSQAAVSQRLEPGQSASLQQIVPGLSGARQRPVSLTHVPPGQVPDCCRPQEAPVQFAPGVEPPEQRICMRSASRKIAELSGTFRPVVEPVEQSPVPVALLVMVLRTQLLVAAPE